MIGSVAYVRNLYTTNQELSQSLSEVKAKNMQLNNEINEQRRVFERSLSNYNETMSLYMGKLLDAEQHAVELGQSLSRLSRDNEELSTCFNTKIPDDVIDAINDPGN